MTPHAIRALPAAALPQVLYEAGLAPADCALQGQIGSRPVYELVNGDAWEPHRSWDHAMPLLERAQASGWLTSQTYTPSLPEARRRYLELMRGTTHHGLHYTRENGPEQVCRVVLLAYYAEWSPAQGDTGL